VRELLEKLAKDMPEGWEVGMEKEMLWILEHPESGEMHYLALAGADRGLAPLTALLKQSLPTPTATERREDGWFYQVGEGDQSRLFVSEFEAVANAYLAQEAK
jgi:hypothetical protein